ncbi:MAG: tRNA pseudouridine(55) synthase TruB [Clostridia bacterium]|nr:tRNA pseudouridine(55) synthase TruB [Clostridia bacterium]
MKNGILVLNKPRGITSQRAVNAVRRSFNMKRVGHAGTLDPLAEGVLPVLLGTATRASEFLIEKDKRYRARILLGVTTDTLDMDGRILSRSDVSITQGDVENALKQFLGEIEQIPPMYSAVSLGGQRLYSLARKGIEVKRPCRKVTVYNAVLAEFSLPYITIDVHCSKGTYIRTLADDLGKQLGCGGAVESLIRTKSGMFNIAQAIEMDSLSEDTPLIPTDKCFEEFEEINLDKKSADRVKNGVPIFYPAAVLGKTFRVYDENGIFTALMEGDTEEERPCLRLIRGFY